MTDSRFLQIHTLSPYTAVLLNRDDSGLAKRLLYGGTLRTRVSSQCLKRHWRFAESLHALHEIDGVTSSARSRDLVTDGVIAAARKRAEEEFPEDVVLALEPWFQFAVYGSKKADRPKSRGEESKFANKSSRQTLLFGEPEIKWLASEFIRLAVEAEGDADKAFRLGGEWVDGAGVQESKRGEKKEFLKNMSEMRERTTLPAGLTGALFGRMVTSDSDANISAPVHVAHAFTVHGEEAETDYFTAVDDLSDDEPGADTIQETELTSGLYYGYVVVDLPGLISNLSGDADLAGQVLHNLIYLIAEISPGAKLGSTAPYSRASFMLLEAGDRQPRSLAEAYRAACAPEAGAAVSALSAHLAALDEAYATGEKRRVMSLVKTDVPGAERGSLADLAGWAKALPAAPSTS